MQLLTLVEKKLSEHTDMEEDDFKSSKKSRIEDYEPLAIDTGRTDYSTGKRKKVVGLN